MGRRRGRWLSDRARGLGRWQRIRQLPRMVRGGGVWGLLLVLLAIGGMLALKMPPTLGSAALHPLSQWSAQLSEGDAMELLTDPFLQLPGPDSVHVVWFTEWPGDRHWVDWGDRLDRQALAQTRRLTRTREDGQSRLPERVAAQRPEGVKVWERPIWRHEAIVSGLLPGQSVPYRVTSQGGDRAVSSGVFRLSPQPLPGQPLQLLLTSDHQLKPMVAANLQQVVATVGRVDGVLFAGDLVNVPDRASEWFDDAGGGAFFPCLQGRANRSLQGHTYQGGAILQEAPLFAALGNHEVMGRVGRARDLNREFYDTVPRWVAQQGAAQAQQGAGDRVLDPASGEVSGATPGETPGAAISPAALADQSFNTRTYEEIWTLPTNDRGEGNYYAVSFGDLRLVVLNVTQAWRSPILTAKFGGRFHEGQPQSPIDWGWGQHIFESITPGSPQFQWLQAELAGEPFRQAKYRVVMFHHPPHTLGDNSVPPFTDPIQTIERDDLGQVMAVKYAYPRDQDVIAQYLSPLLESAEVDLVLYGHSHLWNRFRRGRTHYLETSNVGNSYGAAWGDRGRSGIPPEGSGFERSDYVAIGDPNGLPPIVPSISPLIDPLDQTPQPYLASNEITAFSILDTAAGTVTSYVFDPRKPEQPAQPFDRFTIGAPANEGNR